jgi:dTDP-4-amino-4,6-dideoxygalactose transaminase
VVTHPDADAKLVQLNRAGVQARAYYRVPLHRQPAMARYASRDGRALELPVTEELARTNLALPISPVFTREQADEVVAALAAG